MSSAPPLVLRLNRGVRASTAKWSFLGERPFGGELRLRRFRLGNGLRVVTVVDRSAPTVSYHSWFAVGSRHERPGKTGLAHLFEHLMFGETKYHPLGEFDRLMEESGAEVNAATWTDWTYYYENAPKSALPLLVALEADRMANLVLRTPQVSSEKEVVANERRQRVDDSVEGMAVEQLYKKAFVRHPYSWPTIGWMSDIAGFTVDDCRRFYRSYYAPNRATIVVVGDFNEARALGLIQEHYGHMRSARVPKDRSEAAPSQRRERVARLRAATATEKLLLGFRSPAFTDPDTPALTLAAELLCGGRSSRLYQALCLDQESASIVRGSLAPFEQPGLFELWVSMRDGHSADDALRFVDTSIESLAEQGPSPAELEKALHQLELSFLHGMETSGGKAEQIGFYELVAGDGAAVFDRLEAYRAVTPERVREVTAKYLCPSRRTRIHILHRPS
jgi:zinc protease